MTVMSPQAKEGLFVRYRYRRLMQMHGQELRGDRRLYDWVMDLKPFLKGSHDGKTKKHGTARKVRGRNRKTHRGTKSPHRNA